MANVLITTNCNQTCEFCFARERIKNLPSQSMSLEDVQKVIQFLKNSNFPNLRLMGGEPTLHPQFAEIIELALKEGMHIDLLSNGTWNHKHDELFSKIPPGHLSFLLNIRHPDCYSKKEWGIIRNNLQGLNYRSGVSLSFNILEKRPKSDYIIKLAKEYGIRRIRLSFALPIYGKNNKYLKLEDYKSTVPFIMEFVQKCDENEISVGFDNAIPLCIFSFEEVGKLIMKKVLDLSRNISCEPVIDIGPDLTVWFCFCLSGLFNLSLTQFKNLDEIHQHYKRLINPIVNNFTSLEECNLCDYKKSWNCQGGCLTFLFENRDLQSGKNIEIIEQDFVWDNEALLSLGSQAEIQIYTLPDEHFILRNRKTGFEVELTNSFSKLATLLDGKHRAKEVLANLVIINEPSNNDVLDSFEMNIQEEGIKNILIGFAKAELVEYK